MRVAFLTVDSREGSARRSSPLPYFGTAPEALLQGFAKLSTERLEVHVVSCVKTALPVPHKLAPNIYLHQIMLPSWSFLRMLHTGPILAIRRLLATIKPDIVHAQGTERWCAVSGALSRLPRVLTIHGNLRLINKASPMEPRLYWRTQEMLETFSIPRFDGVVCITDYTRRNIATLARRTWVVPNAVDTRFFDLYPQQAIDVNTEEPRRILFVGNIQERKNQNAFIDAIATLSGTYPFITEFYGQCGDQSVFEREFLQRVNKFAWCSYKGMKGRAELREAFRGASMLVLPSLEDNCPMAVLEAMAAGIPIVASSVGGVPELVKDGVTGLLCNPRDPQSMRSCVEYGLSEPRKASVLAASAHKLAMKRYHPRVIAEEHVRLYREVLRVA
jgi:glycosyltransferase involved in cell wall biosynthesis